MIKKYCDLCKEEITSKTIHTSQIVIENGDTTYLVPVPPVTEIRKEGKIRYEKQLELCWPCFDLKILSDQKGVMV